MYELTARYPFFAHAQIFLHILPVQEFVNLHRGSGKIHGSAHNPLTEPIHEIAHAQKPYIFIATHF